MENGKKISFHGREAKVQNSFQGKVTPKHYISVRNKKGERYKVVNISEIPNPYSKDSPRFHPLNGVCVSIGFNNEDEIKNWLSDLGYKKQPPKKRTKRCIMNGVQSWYRNRNRIYSSK